MPHTPSNRYRYPYIHIILLAVLAGGPIAWAAENAESVTALSVERDLEAGHENEMEIRINRALDEPVSLDVEDMEIGAVVELLAEKAGIPIKIARDTLSLLPYGSKTQLTTSFNHYPLRLGLTALLRPLGLKFVSRGQYLAIVPTPPLKRVIRRATWEELEILQTLYSQPWSESLFDTVRFQFHETGASAEDNRDLMNRLITQVGSGNAAEVLEFATDQYGWTWYPEDKHIVVLSKTEQIERQLEKVVTLKYDQVHIREVLLDLADRAGVLLKMDPGVLASLPPQTGERFLLSLRNSTIRQALELVAGETGISYVIEPDGIRLTSSLHGPAATAAATTGRPVDTKDIARNTVEALRANSIVGQVSMQAEDGTSYSFFIRENDLPPEVNDLRKKQIHKAVLDIGRELRKLEPQD